MSFLYFLIFISTYSLVLAENNVIELTDNDFNSKTAAHDNVLVMFYAPWCGHCKRLKPEYEKAAGLLADNDPPIVFARIDCTEAGKETCNKFSVNGYPTLKIFKNGEVSQEYNGPREASGIAKYMQAQVGPSSREFNSKEEFNRLLDRNEILVVGFFEKDTPLKEVFFKTADKMKEKATFFHTYNPEVLASVGITDGIVLYRPKYMHNKFEPSQIQYTGEPSKEDLSEFVKKN